MAYSNENLTCDYEFGVFRNHRWSYDTTESLATMNTAGFFTNANAVYKRGIQIGDEILVTVWSSAVPASPHPVTASAMSARALVQVIQVNDTTGVIDVADGDSRTLTDSD